MYIEERQRLALAQKNNPHGIYGEVLGVACSDIYENENNYEMLLRSRCDDKDVGYVSYGRYVYCDENPLVWICPTFKI